MVAMCSDRRHPLLRNLNSTVTVDFVKVKPYVNSLLGAINIQVAIVRQTIHESFMQLTGIFRGMFMLRPSVYVTSVF